MKCEAIGWVAVATVHQHGCMTAVSLRKFVSLLGQSLPILNLWVESADCIECQAFCPNEYSWCKKLVKWRPYWRVENNGSAVPWVLVTPLPPCSAPSDYGNLSPWRCVLTYSDNVSSTSKAMSGVWNRWGGVNSQKECETDQDWANSCGGIAATWNRCAALPDVPSSMGVSIRFLLSIRGQPTSV